MYLSLDPYLIHRLNNKVLLPNLRDGQSLVYAMLTESFPLRAASKERSRACAKLSYSIIVCLRQCETLVRTSSHTDLLYSARPKHLTIARLLEPHDWRCPVWALVRLSIIEIGLRC